MPIAAKTRTGVEHKTFRKVKAYTAEADVNPSKRRRLESFATAFFPSGSRGNTSNDTSGKEEKTRDDYDGNPNSTITGPEFLSDKSQLTQSLRAGKVATITKMTLKVADHLIADVKKSSSASSSSSSTTKFVVPKLADRQLSIAMALVTLAKDRQASSAAKKKGAIGGGSFYPIVIASRHKQDADDTNSSLRGLSYLVHNKLNCPGKSVLVQCPVGGDCPATSDVPAALSLDPGDIASVDDAHWKRCTHLVVLHEGGPDSSRQCLCPPELNAKAEKFVMVSAIQHLADEFVSAFVGQNAAAALPTASAEAAPSGDKTVVNAKLLSIEGSVKIQSLWTLLLHNAGTLKKKVVVSCQSRPSAVFHNELFNSLEFTNESQKFELMCDWESRETNTGFVQQRFTNWDVATKNRGCVLLSSTCHLQGADVVVQYDPAPLSGYQAVVDKVANGGSDVATAPGDRSVGRKSAGRNSAAKKPVPTVATKPELVIFVFPCEVKALAAALPAACVSENHTLTLEKINAPAMARGSLIGEEIKKQVNELYALNMKAFEAYKSFMATYAHLQPGTIFNVRALNVDVVSAQFGLTETPMLDLRLKDTRYRPKENWSRAVMARDRQIMKDLRANGNKVEAEVDDVEEEDDVVADEQ